MKNLTDAMSKLINKAELLFSDKQFTALLDSLNVYAICLDQNGYITYCNTDFCNLFNIQVNELIGKNHTDILKPKDNTAIFIENTEIETVTDNEIVLSWQNTPVYNKNENIIGYNCIGQNITEKNKLIDEQLKTIDTNNQKFIELEESDRIKSVFLSNLSHEVRTPVNGIIGFAELLKEEFLDEEKRDRYIDTIQQTSTKLLYILNDILDTSKLSTGHIKLNYEEVNLNNLIDHLCEIYRLDKENDTLKLIVKNGLPDTYSKMILDETHVYQILNKLLNNAFSYTKTGTVEVGYELKDNQIHLFIKDTGIGIDKEQLLHIFDYSSVDKEHDLLIEGTELSLPIIKKRLEMMEGDIQIISYLNQGTSVYIALPHTIALPTKNRVKKERPVSALYSDKLVLLVEDDIFSISIMKEIFDSLNMPIIHTSSGLEAIKICEENKDINLVLMDIRLPDILGTEATMHIKKIRPDLPIIAQTANATTADKELCLNAGCDSYITKPIHIGNLKKMLYRYLIEQY